MVQIKHNNKMLIETGVLTTVLIFCTSLTFMFITPFLHQKIADYLYTVWIYLPIMILGSIIVWAYKRTVDAEKIQKIIDSRLNTQ